MFYAKKTNVNVLYLKRNTSIAEFIQTGEIRFQEFLINVY